MKIEIALVSISKLFSSISVFAIGIILANVLSVKSYGEFTLWLNYLNLFSLIFIFGLSTAHIYYSKENIDNSSTIVTVYMILTLISFFSFYLTENSDILFISSALSFAGMSILNSDSQIKESYKDYCFQICTLWFSILTCVLLYAYITDEERPEDIYMIYSLSVFSVFFYFAVARKKITSNIRLQHSRKFLSYGGKAFSLNLLGQLLYFIDIFILGHLLSAERVAVYAVAGMVAKCLWMLIDSVGIVLFPKIVKSNDNKTKFQSTFSAAIYLLIACLPLLLVFIFFGKKILEISFGSDYIESYDSAIILLLASVPLIIYKLFSRLAASINQWLVSYKALLLSVTVNIILNYALIGKYGIEGAAYASLIAYVICGCYLYISMTKLKYEV
ncbi:oligosaccharide flippase family protein [Vibrio sp. 10N.261.55.F6]|uniref:oligosaccharide flippase family protein n=1 Tax=Vibrio sp. 10N.261.55.F6 TaxID=3229693 RepID=UPI00354D9F1F